MKDGLGRVARGWHFLGVVALLTLPIIVGACASPHVECDEAAFADTVVGRLVVRHGPTATFVVESVVPGSAYSGAGNPPPEITPGARVAVHYFSNQGQYLRVGRSYRVSMWWLSNRFESGVHVANQECSTGTVYANGSAINTSIWLVPWARTAAVAGAVIVLLLALAADGWIIARRRRGPARRRGMPPPANLGL